MKELALITGASTGIGREIALLLAKKKCDLILVARSRDKLLALKEECESREGIVVHVFPYDLAEHGAAERLYRDVGAGSLNVTLLVNNAGVGHYGNFSDTPLEQEQAMIALNVTSVVTLTKLFLPAMKKNGRGRIMNVASLLAFLPFPYYAVYSATKAFVLAFTETIAAELAGTGVTVTTLCPGPVATAFNTPEMWNTNAYSANKPVSPERVARVAVNHLLNGKGTRIVGFNNWFIAHLPRITPTALMMKIKKHLASQRPRT